MNILSNNPARGARASRPHAAHNSQHLLPACALALCLAAGAAWADQIPASTPDALRGDWTVEIDAGIEWSSLAHVHDEPILLICGRDSRLHAYSASDGAALLGSAGVSPASVPQPIAVQPGARPCGVSDDAVFLFSRSHVYALEILYGRDARTTQAAERRAGLRWRVEAALNAPLLERGDPEFLMRVVAAAATERGVLVVRADGQTAELCARTGEIVRRWKLRPLSDCVLHVDGGEIVAVYRSRTAYHVAFLSSDPSGARKEASTLHAPPLWSQLTREGLVCVWADRFCVVSPAGVAMRDFPADVKPSATTVAIWRDGDYAEGSETGQRPVPRRAYLIATTVSGDLWRAELNAERRGFAPPDEPRSEGSGTGEAPVPPIAVPPSDAALAITVSGDYALVRRTDGVRAYNARTGELQTEIPRSIGPPIAAWAEGDEIFVVEIPAGGSQGNIELRIAKNEFQTGSHARTIRYSLFDIRHSPQPLAIHPVGRRLLVVEARRAAAYTPPPAPARPEDHP